MSGDCHGHGKLSRRSVLHLVASPIAPMIAREVQAESEQRAGEVADVKGEAFAKKNSVCGAISSGSHRCLSVSRSAPAKPHA